VECYSAGRCFSWSSGFTIWATSRMLCLQASLTTWLIMTDYLRKIIVQGRSSKTTKVGDIMTEEVYFASYLWLFSCWLDFQPHGSNVTTVWCFFVISLCFSDHCDESQFQKICIWVTTKSEGRVLPCVLLMRFSTHSNWSAFERRGSISQFVWDIRLTMDLDKILLVHNTARLLPL
jgi:hypothetical protein